MITCDDAWPELMDAAESALQAVFPGKSACRVRSTGCHNVKLCFKYLGCLFPQHGPGRKHERRIELVGWQQEIVDAHPWKLIRGLIHSDGCRITNWTTRLVGGKPKRYEYPRYFFTNKSDDTGASLRTPSERSGWSGRSSPGGAIRSTCRSPARRPSR